MSYKKDFIFFGAAAIFFAAAIFLQRHPQHFWKNNGYTAPTEAAQMLEAGDSAAGGQRIRVKYTITVKEGAVPAGKTIHCRLPYPRHDAQGPGSLRFIEAGTISDTAGLNYFRTTDPFSDKLRFSSEDGSPGNLRMKAPAVAGSPTIFYEEFEYTSYGEQHGPADLQEGEVKCRGKKLFPPAWDYSMEIEYL